MNRLQEIETRLKAIGIELEGDVQDLNGLETELNALTEERKGILENVERRNKMLEGIANMPAADTTIVAANKEERSQVKTVEEILSSPEYRSAFSKELLGLDLNESEKRAFVHTTANSPAVVPTQMQDQIFSKMAELHPILNDVETLRSGAVIEISKHVSIVAGDAKIVAEGVANDDEQNEFIKVTLAGKEHSKHVDFSYRLGAVSVPAFETWLVKEIADRLGASMARDIVAQIKTDMAVANKFDAATPGQLVTSDVNSMLGALTGGEPTVYLKRSTLFGAVANMVDGNGDSAFKLGADASVAKTLSGYVIKIEDAVPAGEILVLDPKAFMYNVVQDVLIERDRDIKRRVITIAGSAIAEGALLDDTAAALLTVGEAVVTP